MKKTFFLAGFILLFALVSCNKNDDGPSTGTLSIRITDAPFPIDLVEEANVTINKIEVRQKDGGEEDGSNFIVVSEEEQSFNLLELSNGVTASLVQLDIPVGSYDLIRLYVSESSVLMKDGTEYELKVPSGAQSGLKCFVKPAFEVAGGLTTDLLLDFDVSKSFVPVGNPITGFNFKPVIRVVNMSTAGSISGVVTDNLAEPVFEASVSVLQADTVVTSAFTDIDGNYTLIGLPSGTYDLRVEADGFVTEELSPVNVIAGNATEQNFELEPAQ